VGFMTIPEQTESFYQSLPKVELHRHLEGSLRVSTMAEVAKAHGLDIVGTGQLRPLVQVHESEPYTFKNFLSKFTTLRLFFRSPEVIARVVREAVEDAAADNIRYFELRFTPVALSTAQGYDLGEVMDWVAGHVQAASQEYGVTTRLIASVNRHESVDIAEKVAWLAVDRKGKGFVGIDLAGNEAEFPGEPFAGVFREAQQAGLHSTVHAGEWGGAFNVAEAIVTFGAERIGHGVRVLEDPSIVDLAASRRTAFEVCITSNHQTGVVPSLQEHPIRRMLDRGLNVTLNTDDPSISRITLGHEYQLVCKEFGFTLVELRERVLAAAQAAFLPPAERQVLVQSLSQEFPAV
jgi:adenosine deaminase